MSDRCGADASAGLVLRSPGPRLQVLKRSVHLIWSMASWKGAGAMVYLKYLVVGILSENLHFVRKFSPKMMGIKTPFGEFRNKIKIFQTCNIFCWILVVSVGKLQLPASFNFLNHDAAAFHTVLEFRTIRALFPSNVVLCEINKKYIL